MGRSILRLHEITAGKVYFEGKDITSIKGKEMRALRPQMQIVFQDPYSSLPPRMPVGEIIGEAVKVAQSGPPFGVPRLRHLRHAQLRPAGFLFRPLSA